jgi:hypothetical protein
VIVFVGVTFIIAAVALAVAVYATFMQGPEPWTLNSELHWSRLKVRIDLLERKSPKWVLSEEAWCRLNSRVGALEAKLKPSSNFKPPEPSLADRIAALEAKKGTRSK